MKHPVLLVYFSFIFVFVFVLFFFFFFFFQLRMVVIQRKHFVFGDLSKIVDYFEKKNQLRSIENKSSKRMSSSLFAITKGRSCHHSIQNNCLKRIVRLAKKESIILDIKDTYSFKDSSLSFSFIFSRQKNALENKQRYKSLQNILNWMNNIPFQHK